MVPTVLQAISGNARTQNAKSQQTVVGWWLPDIWYRCMLSIMRAVKDVPDQLIESLDRVSSIEQRSRATFNREAIADFLRMESGPSPDSAFGLWKDLKTDGQRYQDELRAEWKSRRR